MPLSTGSITTTPATPTPTPTPGGSITPDVGVVHAEWVAPDGTVWTLTDHDPMTSPGWHTLPDIIGWGAAPVALATDPLARGGSRVRNRRVEARTITWPLHVWGDTHTEFLARRRAITNAFAMTRRLGPGILRVRRPDASARQISGWYLDGATGNAGEDFLHATLAIQLLCEDPYWRDLLPSPDSRLYDAGATYLSPYPTVSTGRTLGDTDIDNAGDVEAWPTWVITGPMTEATFTNNTTGEAFTITYALDAADTITITTEPPTVRGPADEILTSALDWPGARLWALQPGVNDVSFAVSGSGAGTRVDWSYYCRHETA